MKKNLLLMHIQKIQIEYKELLLNIIKDLESEYREAALDEIVLFWVKKKPIVDLFLRYYLPSMDAYVMTAVTYLDVDEGEQYPFFLAGTEHILDDPLCRYCEICSGVGLDYNLPIEKEIIKCAKDDIKVLERYPEIIVLPLRMFREDGKEEVVKDASKQFFISLFHNVSSIQDYLEKIVSVDDIIEGLGDNKDVVLLSDEDDIKLPFDERFEKARKLIEECFPSNITDGQAFFYLIMGYISQAVDIILSCSEYSCVPYIRYNLVLHYYLLISQTFERLNINCKIKSVCIGNLIYKIADVEKLKCNGDKALFSIIENNTFWNKIKNEAMTVFEAPGAVNAMAEIIDKHLQELYSDISSYSAKGAED